ncbi:MAG: carboxypeptidase-like regulatory domain-containing protein [Aquaticitalea sp.]
MKFQHFTLITFLFLWSMSTFSQQIKGQIIDSKTSEPVAFATIQFDDDKGVVSNMEGFFTLSFDDLQLESLLTVSFMGYETQKLTVNDFQSNENLIKLNEAVNQLTTVYVTNKLPSVDSVMARVNRNLKTNYPASTLKQTLFSRETSFFKANDLVVDIEKSSHFSKKQLASSNAQFKELTDHIVNNPPTQSFTDVLSEVYIKSDGTNKMDVLKATKLEDRKNSLSLEAIQKRVTDIVLKHLDTSKTYKVKTGWFTVEDSMSLKKSKEVKNEEKDNSFNSLKSHTINTMNEHLFGSKSFMDFVLDTNSYDYKLTNVTTINDQLVYVINFEPRKNRAKFKGSMYVADEDYAILKLDYAFEEGKVGEKLNLKLLLGVKYVENVNSGTVIYKKNPESTGYFPYYINHQSGKYMYVHRPFKFIENNDDSKNKVAFDIIIEGSMVEKQELMSLDYNPIDDTTFDGMTESKKVEFIELKQYDPSLWKDYSIVEPLEELKKFKVKD